MRSKYAFIKLHTMPHDIMKICAILDTCGSVVTDAGTQVFRQTCLVISNLQNRWGSKGSRYLKQMSEAQK